MDNDAGTSSDNLQGGGNPPPDPAGWLQPAVEACWAQAEDALKGAETVHGIGLPHIAYHLATLALEEVGKSEILVMEHWAEVLGDNSGRLAGQYDDHVKKLFWALWGPSMGREVITPQQIESFHGLARSVHERRLDALYVDPKSTVLQLPREIISSEEAKNLVSLARARLEMSRLCEREVPAPGAWDDLVWFFSARPDPEKAKFIFSGASMRRLAEACSTREWVSWLHKQFVEAEEVGRAHAERELKRPEPAANDADNPKYEMRIRLVSASHSLRAKPLRPWNEGCNWIKLSVGGPKDQHLLVNVTIPKSVSIRALYWAAWGQCRRFVAALNIGAGGCFWWSFPEHVARYYERLTDLEDSAQLVVERSPSLRIDWRGGPLTERHLANTAMCFLSIPQPGEEERLRPFNHYLAGMAFLCKTDVHLPLEANAYHEFYRALSLGLRQYADWQGESTFLEAFDTALGPGFPDVESMHKYLRFVDVFETGVGSLAGLTMEEAGAMKLLCDAYFLRTFRSAANRTLDGRLPGAG